MTPRILACLAVHFACSALLPSSALALGPVDVEVLLRDADRTRIGLAGPGAATPDNLEVETRVQTLKADGSPDKERRYRVFTQGSRQSLVLMQSPAEKGQKVLMLGDDFWLLMPGSQRPLRITPMQKLLGDASTGDIATLSWSGDYTGQLVAEEPCQPDAAQKLQANNDSSAYWINKKCYQLSLTAKRKGVTYQRIVLWVSQEAHQPVRADLYVQSDKLAKQAAFLLNRPGARDAEVTDMVLVDQLSQGKQTRVSYLSRKEKSVPPEWFNPMYLARNPGLE